MGSIFSFFRKSNPAGILPLMEQHVPKDGVIIDVGAGAGKFTRLFAEAAPQGHVYAFEPGHYLRSLLSKVIAAKKLHNVSLFPMGLGSSASSGSCPVIQKARHTTLDQFVSLHGLKKVDFIRSDAHMSVLQGAHDIINKFRPALFLATNDDGGTTEEVRNFLHSLNYRIEHVGNSGKRLTPLEVPVTKGALWCVAEERRDA